MFGAPFNPLNINDQIERHFDPTSLINPDSLAISQFNEEFEIYLKANQINFQDISERIP